MWARRQGAAARDTTVYQRLRGILILMYAVIVILMAMLPYFFGWRGNPLVSLLIGNLFHLTATAVGTLFALCAAGYIRNRLVDLGHQSRVQES